MTASQLFIYFDEKFTCQLESSISVTRILWFLTQNILVFGYFIIHIAIFDNNLTGNTANISSAVGHTLKKDTKNSEIKIQVGHLDFYGKFHRIK